MSICSLESIGSKGGSTQSIVLAVESGNLYPAGNGGQGRERYARRYLSRGGFDFHSLPEIPVRSPS